MNTFLDLAKHRFSCRKYEDKEVETEKIEQVLEAGRVAPSAKNLQPWRFYVIRDEKMKEKIYGCYGRSWIQYAPAIIVICGDHNQSWVRNDNKDHCDIDAAIAIDHMTLQATDLGLGTCWVCAFDAQLCHQELQLPGHIEPIALLPLGYPKKEADPNRHQNLREPLEKISTWM